MLGLASQGLPARCDSDARLPPGEARPHSGMDQPPALSPIPRCLSLHLCRHHQWLPGVWPDARALEERPLRSAQEGMWLEEE